MKKITCLVTRLNEDFEVSHRENAHRNSIERRMTKSEFTCCAQPLFHRNQIENIPVDDLNVRPGDILEIKISKVS